MVARFRRPRRGAGIQANLDQGEAAMLIQLCRELSDLWAVAEEGPDEASAEGDGADGGGAERGRARDPVLDRLFPRAYLDPTEEESEAEWQRFARPDLVEGRKETVEIFLRTLAGAKQHRSGLEVMLSAEEAGVWLAVINDSRLALGTRLEVTEDTHPANFKPGDPAAAPFAVYWWLGYLEEHLVDTLASGMDSQ
ncbi:MAG: DUF2017 family protein [Acidimicrobiia bacterium]